VSASLSTHVLDAGRGRPAASVRVEVFRDGGLVAAGETGEDGRIANLASELAGGLYRVVFHPDSPFFSRVELEISLEAGHYHVPLIVSPYSCTIYRGS
jgi:5-hydroxyisourate hydrolase